MSLTFVVWDTRFVLFYKATTHSSCAEECTGCVLLMLLSPNQKIEAWNDVLVYTFIFKRNIRYTVLCHGTCLGSYKSTCAPPHVESLSDVAIVSTYELSILPRGCHLQFMFFILGHFFQDFFRIVISQCGKSSVYDGQKHTHNAESKGCPIHDIFFLIPTISPSVLPVPIIPNLSNHR